MAPRTTPQRPREVTNTVTSREVILLTDWDRKGDQLFEKMRAFLAANLVRANGEYRDKIRLWMRPPVRDQWQIGSPFGLASTLYNSC